MNMSYRFAMRTNGSYQVYRKIEGADFLSTNIDKGDFTEWLISYMKYGLQLQGNETVRKFSEEVFSVAKELPVLKLSKKLEDMTVKHYVYDRGEDCSLSSPFHNFVLYGLKNMIDWDEVALAVSDIAR